MPRISSRDGDRLHYYDIGRGPVCVLLHGFGMPGFLWLPVVLPLSHRWRFIIPNLRGFDGSHRLPVRHDNAITQFADDLEDLLAGLRLRDCALAGLSMGACTALEYHARYGFGRVRAYMNIDNPPCVSDKRDWDWGLFAHESSEDFQARLRALVADLERVPPHASFHEIPKPVRRRMWAFFADFSSRAMATRPLRAFCRLAQFESAIRLVAPVDNWPVYVDLMRTFAMADLDWRDTLGALDDTPSEVHIGERSRMYAPAGQERFADYVPHARIVRYPGCGHALMFDAPRVFARNLDGFLGRAYEMRPASVDAFGRARGDG